MVIAQHRFRRAILKQAESFTANGVSRKGIVSIIPPSLANRYLDTPTLDSANRPIYAFFVPDNDGTAESDPIAWDGLSLSILKIVRRRMRGTLLFKMILCH